jgi:hypothetical protein
MSDAAPPIDPDEFLLRRIPVQKGYYDPEKAPPVEAGAFRPNPNDIDGISIYRERLLSVSALVAGTDKAASGFTIARLVARDLLALGFTLEPKQEEGDLPGHVIVPEINVATYKDPDLQKRGRVKNLCKSLADLANKPGAIILPQQDDPSTQ